jgi:hypothetical protein
LTGVYISRMEMVMNGGVKNEDQTGTENPHREK